MKPIFKKLMQQIETLALETVMLDPGDIPSLGKTAKSVEAILDESKRANERVLTAIAEAMKQYIEEVILGERTDLAPFINGVSRLQEICRHISQGKNFKGDIDGLLGDLGFKDPGKPKMMKKTEVEMKGQPEGSAGRNNQRKIKKDKQSPDKGSPCKPDAEDIEIISDFVTESLENLGTIEVRLMDLEHDPNDTETINAIFRPFHTVKGVSGFLNFNKINKLAHIVENLLDKARNRELTIDGEIVDVILDSMDMLKRMIENVRASLGSGKVLEGEEDIAPLINRIEEISSATKGGERKRVGDMLISRGAVTEKDVKQALDIQHQQEDRKIGEILVENEKVSARTIMAALRDQKRIESHLSPQVKVDTVKLDNIVDMVGELAIAQSMLRQHDVIQTSGDRKLQQITNQLVMIVSGLQNTTMSLRMVPIKHTFQKMVRLVRDLARKAGKEIQLEMSGEETEIDRNMVEELYEPMVHMIRNSIDHGLEPPDERIAQNKPRQGTILLKSYHKGGNIVIEIRDDGRGLDREKILKKAVSRELIKSEDKLADSEIDKLIFQPGFSTVEKVTDISGRGVGMDVVKNTVEKLRGRVEIQTTPGKGTVFIIWLPLTLAIVNGMIVKIGNDKYIIPTLNVQESFKPKQKDYFTVKGEGEIIKVRDDLIPMIRLDRLLGRNGNGSAPPTKVAPWEKLVVVVENQEQKRCLLVDELIGQEEVVLKSLGGWLKDIKGIAGSVIMSDGRVGLILDIAGIFHMATREA